MSENRPSPAIAVVNKTKDTISYLKMKDY